MTLIELIVVLVIVGAIVGFCVKYIPMPQPFRAGILLLAAIFCLVMILNALGITHFSMGRVK